MEENCSNDGYFQAKLQLRPFDKKVYDFIVKKVKERGNVSITREVELKEGIDLYITDQRFARVLGVKLKKVFGGELKMTRTLHTRNKLKSKNVYRVTVMFRLLK